MASDLAGKLSDWFWGEKPPKGETPESAKKRRKKRRKKRDTSGNRNQRRQLEKLEY